MNENMLIEDFNWFKENYESFYKKYGHCFVAVKNKQVLGIFHNMDEGIEAISKKEPLGSFIVQECNGKETGYTNFIASLFIA